MLTQTYMRNIAIILAVQAFLMWAVFAAHDKNLYSIIFFISYIWLALTLTVLITNHFFLKKNKFWILNIFNWLLSFLLIGIWIGFFNDKKLAEFYSPPTLAFIPAVIAMIKKFVSQKNNNSDVLN